LTGPILVTLKLKITITLGKVYSKQSWASKKSLRLSGRRVRTWIWWLWFLVWLESCWCLSLTANTQRARSSCSLCSWFWFNWPARLFSWFYSLSPWVTTKSQLHNQVGLSISLSGSTSAVTSTLMWRPQSSKAQLMMLLIDLALQSL
jgi:hypothetical protein